MYLVSITHNTVYVGLLVDIDMLPLSSMTMSNQTCITERVHIKIDEVDSNKLARIIDFQ